MLTRCLDKGRSAVAAGYSNGQINIFNYISKALIASFRGHSSAVSCLTQSSVGSGDSTLQLASGGCDCDIVVWDLGGMTAVCRLRGHKDVVTDVAFVPTSASSSRRLLVSGSKDALLKVWCLDAKCCVQTIVGHRCEIWSVAMLSSPSGAVCVSGGADGRLRGVAVTASAADGARAAAAEGDGEDDGDNVLTPMGEIATQCGADKCVGLRQNTAGSLLAAQSAGKLVEVRRTRLCTQTIIHPLPPPSSALSLPI